jgi:KUP system potassium uptake protein
LPNDLADDLTFTDFSAADRDFARDDGLLLDDRLLAPHRDANRAAGESVGSLADGERSSSASGEMSVIPAAPSQAVVDALASMGSCEISNDKGYSKKVRFEEMPAAAAAWRREETRSEVRELLEEREAGVSYMVGHTCVFAHESSSAVKKFAVNVVYGFLRRNSRRPAVVLGIPHTSLIEVGMAYRV